MKWSTLAMIADARFMKNSFASDIRRVFVLENWEKHRKKNKVGKCVSSGIVENSLRRRIYNIVKDLKEKKSYVTLEDIRRSGDFSGVNQESFRTTVYEVRKKLGVSTSSFETDCDFVLDCAAELSVNNKVDRQKLMDKTQFKKWKLSNIINRLKKNNRWPFEFKTDVYSHYSDIRIKVERLILDDPSLTAKDICRLLNIQYADNGQSVHTYIYLTKKKYNLPTRRGNGRLIE